MADKVYKLIFTKDDGSEDVVQFTAPQGEPGEPGKTPVKGTDYWTEADKAEIVEEVLEQIPASGETWKTLAHVVLEEEAWPVIDLTDYAVNFKALRFFINMSAVTPSSITFALAIPNDTTGMAYNMVTIASLGSESSVSKVFIEFEPLVEEGFCRVNYSWATTPTVSVKTTKFEHQYNSYDFNRLETARYFRPSKVLPVGTEITIRGLRA